jgi:predicted glycogen debranching enzyme
VTVHAAPVEESAWPSVAVAGDLARARREWIHTNGAGAYASSTIAGMHARRYHGLLIAALDPPQGRHLFLSHVDATITLPREGSGPPSRQRWDLAKHQFPSVDPTTGPFYLQRFDQDPLPRWTYAVPAGELEIALALVRGENAAVLRYRFRGKRPVLLTLRPLLAARGFQKLQRENGGMLQRVELRPGEMRVQPKKDLPRLCFRYEGTFVGSPDWWRRFEYLEERDRGLDYEEDLWTPGVFELSIGDAPSYLVAGVDHLPTGEPEALFAATEAALLAEDPGPSVPLLQRRLFVAAEAFRADLAPRPGIVAGYPDLEARGRDALIALPGLYLVPKKTDAAIRVLREILARRIDGLVPGRIGEGNGASELLAADTSLWLFEAARHMADALGDGHAFVTYELRPALHDAFEAVIAGKQPGIHLTADGLFAVSAGASPDPRSAAPTWMDARLRGAAVTPRLGCPIELSALWARGCDTLARLARAAGDATLAERAAAERDRTRAAFHRRFWCEATTFPYDVVSELDEGPGAFRDAAIRPNAVIALAVDPECFTAEQATVLLDRAQCLVTRSGLRALAKDDPGYTGRASGSAAVRDAAAHQGAVWPWLLGFFVRAASRSADGERLAPLLQRLVASAAVNELAVGQVAQLADGDAPHAPGGAVAHAASVAELLRALCWDLH